MADLCDHLPTRPDSATVNELGSKLPSFHFDGISGNGKVVYHGIDVCLLPLEACVLTAVSD